MWVGWRSFVGKVCWLQNETGEFELVAELVEFMEYCCAEKGIKETTIAGKVSTNFYFEQFVGLSVTLRNPLIRSAKECIKRAPARRERWPAERRVGQWWFPDTPRGL